VPGEVVRGSVTATCESPVLADLAGLDPADESFAARVVDAILQHAPAAGASDVHLVPAAEGLRMSWRLDGVLQPVTIFAHRGPNIVARLKVLAQLPTYRTDVPQEGRLQSGDDDLQVRVSTFPTLYGEKAVIRLFGGSGKYQRLDDLGLPGDVAQQWRRLLSATSGVLVISGPAGSGKTTTLYASLREIIAASADERSLVSLEDPIEAVVPGVAQSQVASRRSRDDGDTFDYARGLRSILRQDPEVIMVGEIRDRETAETVFQASLSGHLVLTSFHAGSSAEAISRVADMGIEPYLLRSGLLGILSLRLLRQLCECRQPAAGTDQSLGLPVENFWVPQGCERCRQTGYDGRLLLAELLQPEMGRVGEAILARTDTSGIQRQAVAAGLQTLYQRALGAIVQGATSPQEVRRVFGVLREVSDQTMHPAPPS
jgi:general secretion pathway protein E